MDVCGGGYDRDSWAAQLLARLTGAAVISRNDSAWWFIIGAAILAALAVLIFLFGLL
jgi:ribulose kinase